MAAGQGETKVLGFGRFYAECGIADGSSLFGWEPGFYPSTSGNRCLSSRSEQHLFGVRELAKGSTFELLQLLSEFSLQ